MPHSRDASASAFVTVTAKVSIALGIAATLYALLQVAVAQALLGQDQAARALAALPVQELPAAASWLLTHLGGIAWSFLLTSAAFLAASWGLLRRRPWGWWGFVAFMVLGALVNFAGIALVEHVFDWVETLPRDPTMQELQDGLTIMRQVSLVTMWGTAIAFAVLHGAIVWKLCRPEVRAEFRPG